MNERLARHRALLLGLIAGLVLLGAWLRLDNLGASTIGHIEIYVPNIPLPEGLSFDPPPRVSLLKAVTGPIAGEPHPPGFYALMYFWTELFGVGKVALRLPSALFGIGSVLAVILLGRLEKDWLTALLAGGMLALNGLSIYWAQIARMYSFATFFGLASTVLLVWMVQRGRAAWWAVALYAGLTLAGVSTVLFYWPIFAVQVLWTLLIGATRGQPVRSLLRWQTATLILASPLWSIVVFQTRWTSPASFGGSILAGLSNYLEFGILLEPRLFVPDPWEIAPAQPWAVAGMAALVVAALLLLVVGFKTPAETAVSPTSTIPPLPPRLMPAVTAVGVLGVLGFTALAYTRDPRMVPPVLATVLLPLLLFGGDALLERLWPAWQRWAQRRLAPLRGYDSLSSLLALLPAVVVALSLYAPRTISLYVPYLLVVLSRGLATLLQRRRVWLALAGLLLLAHVASSVHYRQRLHHPTDYEGLAEQWIPQIRPDDLVFVQLHWATPSMFYYLDVFQYQVVGQAYAAAAAEHPDARIWVLEFEDLPLPDDMTAVLAGYEPVETVEALRTSAVLYEHLEP